MSWLGRLLGRSAEAPSAVRSVVIPEHLAARSVFIPEDLAAALTAGGTPLAKAVEAGLRAYVAAASPAAAEDGRVPFWLARDREHTSDIEAKLLDRMAQRRDAAGGDPLQLELGADAEVKGRGSDAGAKTARARSSTSGGGPKTVDG